MKSNTRVQKFEVTVETVKRDGCGNEIRPVNEGEVRRSVLNGVGYADSVTVKEVARKPRKSDALALADLIEEYIAAVDEEMEHGNYCAPECVIPYKFEDEDGEDGRPDYWERHDEIVDNAVKAGQKVRDFIAKLRGEK